MISGLYRKLYFYAALGVILAMLLTMLSMELLFSQREKQWRAEHQQAQRSQAERFYAQVEAAARKAPPLTSAAQTALSETLKTLAEGLGWRVSYWRAGQLQASHGGPAHPPLSESEADSLSQGLQLLQGAHPFELRFSRYLVPTRPEWGYLQLSALPPAPHLRPPGRLHHPGHPPGPPPHPPGPPPEAGLFPPRWSPPVIFGSLMLLALAFLLIPFIFYILKPFKALARSIERVSQGDFSQPVAVVPRSDFYAIASAFNGMTAKIEAMIAEKQRLVADVSHELRSPLARLRVSLELLDKESRGNPRYIHKAIQEVQNLDQLINDLLDLSGLELNPHQQTLERIPLQALLHESLEAHQLLFDKHRLQLQLQWPEHKVSILGRRDLLERALNNLLSNLLKYAPEGSVAEIGIFVRDQQVSLRLRDHGPGLSAEELAKVGQPFYRPDSSRTRKTGGTGLGLAIVQRIMQLHRGQLLLQTPGDGQGGLEAILIWPLQAGTARLDNSP